MWILNFVITFYLILDLIFFNKNIYVMLCVIFKQSLACYKIGNLSVNFLKWSRLCCDWDKKVTKMIQKSTEMKTSCNLTFLKQQMNCLLAHQLNFPLQKNKLQQRQNFVKKRSYITYFHTWNCAVPIDNKAKQKVHLQFFKTSRNHMSLHHVHKKYTFIKNTVISHTKHRSSNSIWCET